MTDRAVSRGEASFHPTQAPAPAHRPPTHDVAGGRRRGKSVLFLEAEPTKGACHRWGRQPAGSGGDTVTPTEERRRPLALTMRLCTVAESEGQVTRAGNSHRRHHGSNQFPDPECRIPIPRAICELPLPATQPACPGEVKRRGRRGGRWRRRRGNACGRKSGARE
jgi:hypothetical protein